MGSGILGIGLLGIAVGVCVASIRHSDDQRAEESSGAKVVMRANFWLTAADASLELNRFALRDDVCKSIRDALVVKREDVKA